jgi:two-component system, response regulator
MNTARINDVDIVYVEDNEADAELAMRAFRKRGLTNRVLHLEDGAQALDFLFARGPYTERDLKTMPRLLLLDVKMPFVDGLEVLRQVKSDPRLRTIPVVMLTSSQEDRDVNESYRLGANGYVVKPVDFDEFSQTVGDAGYYWAVMNRPPRV